MSRRFFEPRQCLYWRDPKRVRDSTLKEQFELVAPYADDSHLRRYLLKCRECGQLYFFEFYETIDWDNGNDPQYTKYIPVSAIGDAEELSRLGPSGLLNASPRLCIDFPKEAKSPIVYWVGKRRQRTVISSVCGRIKAWLSSALR